MSQVKKWNTKKSPGISFGTSRRLQKLPPHFFPWVLHHPPRPLFFYLTNRWVDTIIPIFRELVAKRECTWTTLERRLRTPDFWRFHQLSSISEVRLSWKVAKLEHMKKTFESRDAKSSQLLFLHSYFLNHKCRVEFLSSRIKKRLERPMENHCTVKLNVPPHNVSLVTLSFFRPVP